MGTLVYFLPSTLDLLRNFFHPIFRNFFQYSMQFRKPCILCFYRLHQSSIFIFVQRAIVTPEAWSVDIIISSIFVCSSFESSSPQTFLPLARHSSMDTW